MTSVPVYERLVNSYLPYVFFKAILEALRPYLLFFTPEMGRNRKIYDL